jgi:hypothetical protein
MLNSSLFYFFCLTLGWSIWGLVHLCLPLLCLRTCSRQVLNALIYKGPSVGRQPCSCEVMTPDLNKQVAKSLALNRFYCNMSSLAKQRVRKKLKFTLFKSTKWPLCVTRICRTATSQLVAKKSFRRIAWRFWRIWKEAIAEYFKILSKNLLWRTEDNQEQQNSRLPGWKSKA